MTDKTEATEMVLNKIDEYMNAAKTVIETYGGDVADLGLLALRVEAGSEIFLPLLLSFGLLFMIPLMIRTGKKIWEVQKEQSTYEVSAVFLYVFHLAWGGFLFGNIFQALNLWAWVGLFYPEAYAVHLFLLK
jgi:hypothetical protein